MYGKKRVYANATKKVTKKAKTAKIPYAKPRFNLLSTNNHYSFAKSLRVTHRYQDNFTVTGTLGASGVYVFSLNGLYDPNITGVGHQPAGFDEMSAIYVEYCVVGFKVRVMAKNTNATTSAIAAAFVTRGAASYSSLQRYIENGYGVYKTLGAANLTNDSCDLYIQGDMNELTGESVLNDSVYSSTTASNPTEQRYLHVSIQSFDVASTITAAQFNIEIAYDVVWRDRAGMVPS